MKKILSIDGFRYNSEERLREIKNTLEWNSKFFDVIHVWCQENEDYLKFKEYDSEKICVHNLNRTEMISMKQLYDFTNEVSNDEDFKFFTNSDTTFGEEIINFECEDNTFLLFTNRSMRDPSIGQSPEGYKHSDNDGLKMFNTQKILDRNWFMNDETIRSFVPCAHCGWAWKTKKFIAESGCFLGNQGGENCFLNKIYEAGFKPKSAAIRYPTYHNHRTNERTQRHNHRTYGMCLPSPEFV